MRILAVSNLFPPADRSGGALECEGILQSLRVRGHEVRVLAGAAGRKKFRTEGDLSRRLLRDPKGPSNWQTVLMKEVVNQASFKMACRDFEPDLVFFFDLSQISASLVLLAKEAALPACSYIFNDWLATWERDRWYQTWPKGRRGFRMLRFLSGHRGLTLFSQPLDPGQVIFASGYLEAATGRAGKGGFRSAVVLRGVDVRRFSNHGPNVRSPSRLLHPGPIRPQKGIDTAIKALGVLKRQYDCEALSMTIAGDDKALPDYVAYLRDLAAAEDVLESLAFAGYTPYENMPDLYRAHDIFVFTSVIVEPLTVSLLEAMSSGLGVVSTATGGNSEVLEDELNSLIIPNENPERCAQQILRLLKDPNLYETLRAGARKTIEERFRLEKSVDSIEEILKKTVGEAKRNQSPLIIRKQEASPEAARSESLDDLMRRTEQWLKWGSRLVLARNLIKPASILKGMKKALQKSTSFTALLIFPLLYKGYSLLRGRPEKSSGSFAERPRGVLIVQLADLGDVILTSAFLRELRKFLPRAKLALVVQPGMANVVEKCPYIDELLLFNWRTAKNWRTAFQGDIRWWLKGLWTARRGFRRSDFDTAVSLRWNNDACQAAALIMMSSCGAPRRLAYLDSLADPKRSSLKCVDRLITEGPVRGAPKHEIEYQLDLLRFLGGRPVDAKPEVWTGPEDERFSARALDRRGVPDHARLIAFAPGAAWAYRRWPADRFIELGRWLQENYRIYILLLAGKAERPLARLIESGLDRERTINLAGKTTFREMASVLKRCELFLGNDSGPMHVAVASGVTAVGLFGPGEYERFRPWGTNHEVIRLGLTCNPCSEDCKFGEALCIKGVTVDQVQRVLAKKLGPVLK